jgi:prephenate dehydratase
MADHGLNLTKIQSIPIPEEVWKYAFIVDVAFTSLTHFQEAFKAISNLSINPTCVGQYKSGKS